MKLVIAVLVVPACLLALSGSSLTPWAVLVVGIALACLPSFWRLVAIGAGTLAYFLDQMAEDTLKNLWLAREYAGRLRQDVCSDAVAVEVLDA